MVGPWQDMCSEVMEYRQCMRHQSQMFQSSPASDSVGSQWEIYYITIFNSVMRSSEQSYQWAKSHLID